MGQINIIAFIVEIKNEFMTWYTFKQLLPVGRITGHQPKINERTYYPLEVEMKQITVES